MCSRTIVSVSRTLGLAATIVACRTDLVYQERQPVPDAGARGGQTGGVTQVGVTDGGRTDAAGPTQPEPDAAGAVGGAGGTADSGSGGVGGPDAAPAPSPERSVLGFEDPSGWSVDKPAGLVLTATTEHVEGAASLSFDAGTGAALYLTSAPFDADALGPPRSKIGFSMSVAVAPGPAYQPYVNWDLRCTGGGDYIGGAGLLTFNLEPNAWTRIPFDVKPAIAEIFARRLSGCTFSLRFDNLRGVVRLDGISFAD